MAVKLRLMRMGKKKQPTYRIVAADARSPRDGRFIEIVGTYQPRRDPSVVEIDNDRAVHWLRHGAQPTERVEKLLRISGAWEAFTGEAAPPVVTRAASAGEPETATAPDEAGTEDTAAADEEPEAHATVEEPAAEADQGGAEAPYGEGSHAPLDDVDESPDGYPIKGNADSMLYHTPESPHYGRTKAEVWFASAEAAEAAGFSAPGASHESDENDSEGGES